MQTQMVSDTSRASAWRAPDLEAREVSDTICSGQGSIGIRMVAPTWNVSQAGLFRLASASSSMGIP